MTIRRFVPEAADRKNIGHIEVSIDDLDALLTLLRDRPDISEVKVEFEGGELTEAGELEQLSDAELRELRVIASGLVIHLSASRAEAIGNRELVAFTNDAWARARQTRVAQPNTTWAGRNLLYCILYAGWSGIAAFLVYNIFANPSNFPGLPPVVSIPLIVVTFGGMIAFMVLNMRAYRRSLSWAIIHPLKVHKLRERRSANTKVPLWSLLVAIAAFTASTILGILGYMSKLN